MQRLLSQAIFEKLFLPDRVFVMLEYLARYVAVVDDECRRTGGKQDDAPW